MSVSTNGADLVSLVGAHVNIGYELAELWVLRTDGTQVAVINHRRTPGHA